MDRNTLYGLLLIAAIFIGFSLYNSNQSKKAYEKEIVVADSLYRAQDLENAVVYYRKSLQYSRNDPHAISRLRSIDSIFTANRPQQADSLRPDSLEMTGPATRTVEQGSSPEPVTDVVGRYGDFAGAAQGEQKFIVMENSLIRMKISSRGGRVYSVELKNFKTWDNHPLILFDGDSTYFGLNFFAGNRTISTNDLYFEPADTIGYYDASQQEQTLTMRLPAGEGRYVQYAYTLKPDSYLVGFNVLLEGMNQVISNRTTYLDMNWEIKVPQQEKGRDNENNYTTIDFKYYQDETDGLSARSKGETEEVIRNRVRWIAFKQQFFSSVLIADQFFTSATIRSYPLDPGTPYLKKFRAEISIPYENQPEEAIPLAFYFGPNHYNTLKKHNLQLEDLVTLGGFVIRWINLWVIIPIFNFLNKFIGNYGIIILLLTIIIKVVLFPLTYRSYLSQAKMRVLKPYVDEINAKYPKRDDAMKKQQATMDLYKKAGVSPLGGCLPMLLQFPILFAMFRFFPTSIELRQKSFLWASDLSTYDSILDLPFNIPL